MYWPGKPPTNADSYSTQLWAKTAPSATLPSAISGYTWKQDSKPQPEKGWLVSVVRVFWELLTESQLHPTCPAEINTSCPAARSSYRIEWTRGGEGARVRAQW